MIKLLHTADLHLGCFFPSLCEKGKEHRLQLLNTFDKIIELAISENVSVFLIAGDLFDTNRVPGTIIARVLVAFKRLGAKGISVCILPGTHDPFNDESIYRFVDFGDNVKVFTPKTKSHIFNDLNLTIYGNSHSLSRTDQNPLKGLVINRETQFHVCMAHCSIKIPGRVDHDNMLLEQNEIGSLGFQYLALGHWHSLAEYSNAGTKAYYSGSPEPVSMDQKGSGNIIVVEIDQNDVRAKPIKVGQRFFASLTLDVGPIASVSEIISAIEAKSDRNLILQVILEGLASVDLDVDALRLETELADKFFNLSIVDESQPCLAGLPPDSYPENTIEGKYIRLMQGKIAQAEGEDKKIAEDALKLGFALLQGREEVIE